MKLSNRYNQASRSGIQKTAMAQTRGTGKNQHDPFITLAIALDPYVRKPCVKNMKSEFCSIEKDSYAAITNKLFTHYGEMLYPDAYIYF